MVETVNGIRTYKIAAVQGRTQARDLYYLEYLTKAYGHQCSTKQIQTITVLLTNPDRLAGRYEPAFAKDCILGGHSGAEEMVLQLQENLAKILEGLASKVGQCSPVSSEEKQQPAPP